MSAGPIPPPPVTRLRSPTHLPLASTMLPSQHLLPLLAPFSTPCSPHCCFGSNGAYYYYNTEPSKNYEQTLYDVKDYAEAQKIPYRYVLLDSWWYFQGHGGGVNVWDARPDVFPDGLAAFQQKTQWGLQLHNRYWATDTNYSSRNGGDYTFIDDGSSVVVPNDQRFWDDLIANKSKLGMFMYEQDWLDTEFDRSKTLGESATMAREWMLQMNNGCAKSNVTIQMCMSHVRHILQSLEMPAVTNARASGDYHPGSGQWNVGTSSILAHAVGEKGALLVFFSPLHQPLDSETCCRLARAVSLLTSAVCAWRCRHRAIQRQLLEHAHPGQDALRQQDLRAPRAASISGPELLEWPRGPERHGGRLQPLHYPHGMRQRWHAVVARQASDADRRDVHRRGVGAAVVDARDGERCAVWVRVRPGTAEELHHREL